jgi:NADH:ubiquinone reductase (H+-translocating)
MLNVSRAGNKASEVQGRPHQPPRIVILGGGFAGVADRSCENLNPADRGRPAPPAELCRVPFQKGCRAARKLGVTIMPGTRVEHVDEQGVIVAGKRIKSATMMWTAGVAPSPRLSTLGVNTDHVGRVCVGPFLEIPDQPGIFVVGDAAAATQGGGPLPGVAQVTIQQGRYVGGFISALLNGRPKPRPFWYSDRGDMAVVRRNFAIMESGQVRLGGFMSFWIWAFIHLASLPQMQNRGRVHTQWLWSYLAGQRGARLIPEDPRAADDLTMKTWHLMVKMVL